jgi:hypothetical protein
LPEREAESVRGGDEDGVARKQEDSLFILRFDSPSNPESWSTADFGSANGHAELEWLIPEIVVSSSSRRRSPKRGAYFLGGSTIMGDKSPKSKQRDQKQKTAARAEDAAQARSKQDSHSHVKPTPAKVTR